MAQQSLRADMRAFWWLVRAGEGFREAALALGYDATAGLSWARRTGGVCPDFARSIPVGRYLCLEERIEILVGLRLGRSIREVARDLGPIALDGATRATSPKRPAVPHQRAGAAP